VRLLVVSGFLGSGKTSLILWVARALTGRALKVAIIENEIGEIGIDGRYLREEGLQVQELFGGCICCTLSTDLVLTLREIRDRYEPDWAVVEPTGLATPSQVVQAVGSNLPEIEEVRVICVVDASRYDLLLSMMTPLLTAQIEDADTIAINKVDLVDRMVVKRVVDGVKQMNPRAAVSTISAEKGLNLDSILEVLR
jgi:G3E family GTPase